MDMKLIGATPTVKTSAYTANKCVGSPLHLTQAFKAPSSGLLRHVLVKEVGTQKAPLTLVVLNADPGTAFVDSATPDFTALAGNIVGKVDVAAADYETVGGVSIADTEVNRLVSGAGGKDLWVVIVGTGTPTFGSNVALSFGFGIMRDE